MIFPSEERAWEKFYSPKAQEILNKGLNYNNLW